MNSNFGLKEDFDIELKKSNPIDELTFKGIMQVVHKREGEVLSVDRGENVITNTGKAELVRLMGQLVTSEGVTPATANKPMAFHYIGLGRKGSQSASATDTMLGGSLTNSFTKADLEDSDNTADADDAYYVSTLGTSGFEYNKAFVKDANGTASSLVSPRTAGNTTGTATTDTDTSKNFYHAINETTILDDTLLWYAKFIFGGIGSGGVYVPAGGGTTVTINEAGIFNRPHTYAGTNADPMPVMLARRTFSDKPVKNNDELTIKWQITIK